MQLNLEKAESIIADAARSCEPLVIECSDVAGDVVDVAKRLNEQAAALDRLDHVTTLLSDSQREVVNSIDRARSLSQAAKQKLGEGRLTIEESVSAFNELTGLVLKLGARTDALAGAMSEVQATSILIGAIARQSELVALNATIEAARAGNAGRCFAVVAAEVRKLADDTRSATETISRTVDELAHEAGAMNSDISDGVTKTRAAQTQFAALGTTVGDIDGMVGLIDYQTNDIESSADTICRGVERVRSEMELFSDQTRANGTLMSDARERLAALEAMTNQMLDQLASSGARTDDSEFISTALDYAREIMSVVERHLESGTLTEVQVFDTDYVAVPGTDPQQLTCRFNAFADRYIRPILDRASAENDKMIGCVVTDMNGYLPTHITLRSQPQRPDREWNASWSRHRRVIIDEATRRALACTRPYMHNCSRMFLGSGAQLPLKSVFVPLIFHGRRWGIYEHSYVNAASAASELITEAALRRSLAEFSTMPAQRDAA